MDEPKTEYFEEYYEEKKSHINRRRRILYHTNKAYRARVVERQKEYDKRKAIDYATVNRIIDDVAKGGSPGGETNSTSGNNQGDQNIRRKRGRPRKYFASQDVRDGDGER